MSGTNNPFVTRRPGPGQAGRGAEGKHCTLCLDWSAVAGCVQLVPGGLGGGPPHQWWVRHSWKDSRLHGPTDRQGGPGGCRLNHSTDLMNVHPQAPPPSRPRTVPRAAPGTTRGRIEPGHGGERAGNVNKRAASRGLNVTSAPRCGSVPCQRVGRGQYKQIAYSLPKKKI